MHNSKIIESYESLEAQSILHPTCKLLIWLQDNIKTCIKESQGLKGTSGDHLVQTPAKTGLLQWIVAPRSYSCIAFTHISEHRLAIQKRSENCFGP